MLLRLSARLLATCSIASKGARPGELSGSISLMHLRLLSLTRRSALATPTPLPSAWPGQRALHRNAAAASGLNHPTSRSSRFQKLSPRAKPVAMEVSAQPAAKKQRLEAGQGAAAVAVPTEAAAEQAPMQSGKGSRKKKKDLTPESQVRLDIQMATRDGNIEAALAVYERAKAQGIRVTQDSYCSLLFMCSLGDSWEASVPKGGAQPAATLSGENGAHLTAAAEAQPEANGDAQPPLPSGGEAAQHPVQPPEPNGVAAAAGGAAVGEAVVGQHESSAAAAAAAADTPPRKLSAAEVMARGKLLFEELQQLSKQPPEMCYTALARMAAVAGDPEQAFQIVKDMQAAGIAPKLRSFTPALAGFAERGEFARAAEVDATIAGAALDLTEAEYARLMQAAAGGPGGQGGASWEQGRGVLLRIGRELTVLQRATLERIEAFFASPQAQAAAGGQQQQLEQQQREQQHGEQDAAAGGWQVVECRVGREGDVDALPAGSGRMAAIDLDDEEWEAFREGIAALAEKQERRPNEFKKFLEWMERHGPFGAVVDGANVALYGQNFEAGGFTFGQIKAVRNYLLQQHPDLRPLVILHNGRTKAPQARTTAAQALLAEMQEAGQFFATPTGSNDDWYWIYAAVAAGGKGLLVSNDEMRDHIFQLLAPKFFMKWKQRHQLKYKFGVGGLQFEYPAPYTTCVQNLSCGSWVFPAAEGPWMCARRAQQQQQQQGAGRSSEEQLRQASAQEPGSAEEATH